MLRRETHRALSKLMWHRDVRLNDVENVSRTIDSFQTLSPAQARRALGSRLLATLRYFAFQPESFPEWRELASTNDPEAVLEGWSQLPIMTKTDLRLRFNPDEIARRMPGEGVIDATGGSTGEPTRFFHDWALRSMVRALTYWSWQQMGWHPGLKLLCLWGAQRDIGHRDPLQMRIKKTFVDGLYDLNTIDGFAITEERALEACDFIAQRGPVALYGYTSLLDYLAHVAQKHKRADVRGQVHCAWNGGETLFPEQSERFQAAFGVPILNLYAGRELGVLAVQPGAGQPLLIPRPYVHLEIVDAKGKPAAPGEMGRLLVSYTTGHGTPFLRYDVGDLAVFNPRYQDACGLFGLEGVQGRVSSLLELNGQRISNIYWNHLLKEYPEVRQFQIVARRSGGLLLRFVGDGFTSEREARLRHTILHFLGTMPLAIEWPERLPLSPTGKLIQVVHE